MKKVLTVVGALTQRSVSWAANRASTSSKLERSRTHKVGDIKVVL
jgi:hypothetical protein